MKSLVSLTACFVCMAALGDSGSLATNLSGYWAFDETSGGVLRDSSGHGKNGNLVNFPGGQGNWTSGAIGGALQFGGPSTHQYVSVTNITMPTTSMTLTAWILANSFPTSATIAANWNGGWGDFNYETSFSILNLFMADGQNSAGIN